MSFVRLTSRLAKGSPYAELLHQNGVRCPYVPSLLHLPKNTLSGSLGIAIHSFAAFLLFLRHHALHRSPSCH